MPILKRNELEFGDADILFLNGVVDECSLSEYEDEIDGFQLRILLDDIHAGKHVYWKARINDFEQFEQYDLPKLQEIFGYDRDLAYLIDSNSDRYFIGKPVGVTIKPNPKKDDRYYVGIFKPRGKKIASEEAKEKFRAKMGILKPEPLSVEDDSDLPF